jgi:hypothetical protein
MMMYYVILMLIFMFIIYVETRSWGRIQISWFQRTPKGKWSFDANLMETA